MKFKVGDRVAFTNDDGKRSLGSVTIVDKRGQPPWVSAEIPDDPQIYIKWDDGDEDVYFEYDFDDLEVV